MSFELTQINNNPRSVGNSFVGQVGLFNYDGTRFYFNSLHSSTVKSITIIETTMTIQTRNTEYVFEAVT